MNAPWLCPITATRFGSTTPNDALIDRSPAAASLLVRIVRLLLALADDQDGRVVEESHTAWTR
jgi:hypothetical protein